MVISAAGMAICLLCGSCGDLQSPEKAGILEPAGFYIEEVSRQVQEEREEARQEELEQQKRERAARLEFYRVCESGTVVSDALSEAETSALPGLRRGGSCG